MAVQVEG